VAPGVARLGSLGVGRYDDATGVVDPTRHGRHLRGAVATPRRKHGAVALAQEREELVAVDPVGGSDLAGHEDLQGRAPDGGRARIGAPQGPDVGRSALFSVDTRLVRAPPGATLDPSEGTPCCAPTKPARYEPSTSARPSPSRGGWPGDAI